MLYTANVLSPPQISLDVKGHGASQRFPGYVPWSCISFPQ